MKGTRLIQIALSPVKIAKSLSAQPAIVIAVRVIGVASNRSAEILRRKPVIAKLNVSKPAIVKTFEVAGIKFNRLVKVGDCAVKII